jgi:hypothetical protein
LWPAQCDDDDEGGEDDDDGDDDGDDDDNGDDDGEGDDDGDGGDDDNDDDDDRGDCGYGGFLPISWFGSFWHVPLCITIFWPICRGLPFPNQNILGMFSYFLFPIIMSVDSQSF